MIGRCIAFIGMTALSACQTVEPTYLGERQVISPALAVMAAADAAPRGFPGTFGFTVYKADAVGQRFFLNSYPDYRDQRNLSVAIDHRALSALRQKYGPDLRAAFLGKTIEVDGVARRQRIDFTIDGRPSGKYYFQTHVDVVRPEQIRVLD